MPEVKMHMHAAFPGELIWHNEVMHLNYHRKKTLYAVWCSSRECVEKFKLNQGGNPDIFTVAHSYNKDEALVASSNHAMYHKGRGDTISWD